MTDARLDRSYAALFRLPVMKRLLLGMIVARVAGSMVSVAVILFCLTHYESPAVTGIVTFASLVALCLFLLPPSVPLVLLAMAATGALNAPASVTMFTLRQRRTDPAWMGRAFAISMSFTFAGYPVGTALAGALADRSTAGPILVGAAMSIAAGLLALRVVPAEGKEYGVEPAPVVTAASAAPSRAAAPAP